MPDPLLTGDPLDPRFDPPTWEEQDYLQELFVDQCGFCGVEGPDRDGNWHLHPNATCPRHGVAA